MYNFCLFGIFSGEPGTTFIHLGDPGIVFFFVAQLVFFFWGGGGCRSVKR